MIFNPKEGFIPRCLRRGVSLIKCDRGELLKKYVIDTIYADGYERHHYVGRQLKGGGTEIKMIKTSGEMAMYKGKEYEFLFKSNGTCAIYSNEKEDIHNGFYEIDINRYMRIVDSQELDFIYEKKTIVFYKGDEFTGSVIENNKIMLYTRNSVLGGKYNMIMRDKDEYYLYVDLKEVDEIVQKWIPIKI